MRQREARRADAGAEFDRDLAGPRVGRGREQDRVMAEAMAAPRLAQHEPPAEHGVLGGVDVSRIGTKLVAEAGIGQQPARARRLLVLDQHAARQHAERAFQHAHVLVEHHVADSGALEQRLDRRYQDRVIGANDLAHADILQDALGLTRALTARQAAHLPLQL